MKRTFYRATAATLAVVAPASAIITTSPTALAAPVTVQGIVGDSGIAPAELQFNTTTPFQRPEETKWRDIVTAYRKAGYPVEEVSAYSPSMNRMIPLVLIRPLDPAKRENAPTVYLLNGADGGQGRANWLAQTDVIEYWGGNEGRARNQKKSQNDPRGQLTSPGIGANIIIPMAGQFSYYTDWVQQNPALQGVDKNGKPSGQTQKWETFLTEELPQALEPALKANGKRAIVGMSMTGTTSLLYAEHHPGFYDSVGSFSGCAATTTPEASMFMDITLNRGGANLNQVWGGTNTKEARDNDALLNVNKLKGQPNIYVSNGSGLAGRHDVLGSERIKGDLSTSGTVIIEGGVIEAATNHCTHELARQTAAAKIPVTFNFRPQGTHQWGYWQDDLRDYWPVLVKGLGTNAVQPGPKEDPNHSDNGGSMSVEGSTALAALSQ